MKKSKETKTQTKNNSIPIRLITPQEWEEMDKEMEEWIAESKKRGGKFCGEE